ncbi:MAG: DUF1802 family protein [Deltaproteobacteria bacterium]|nr:DUF1802 family protein [Deltaproteobacteria bacterium]MBI4373498.1 DUF1802 family protein [Deltaproteobacteria bacterium]
MNSCNKLLKEWAIVCDALGSGKQIFIARKGGIAEEEGEFVIQNREFFLFPTYLHQNRESLIPSLLLDFELSLGSEPRDGKLHLRQFARVVDEIKVTHPSLLEKLRGQHLWEDSLLKSRFEWGNERALRLVLLRVYGLPEEIRIPMKQNYGGCKSWVTLEKELPIPQGLKPALSDSEFFEKRERLLKLLF